jgi:hypothetical protein
MSTEMTQAQRFHSRFAERNNRLQPYAAVAGKSPQNMGIWLGEATKEATGLLKDVIVHPVEAGSFIKNGMAQLPMLPIHGTTNIYQQLKSI